MREALPRVEDVIRPGEMLVLGCDGQFWASDGDGMRLLFPMPCWRRAWSWLVRFLGQTNQADSPRTHSFP